MKQHFNKRLTLELIIHIVSWFLVLGFPLVFIDRGSNTFNWGQYLRHSCVPFCYFIIFYANYLWLVPHFFFQDNIRKYIAMNGVLIICISVLLHFTLDLLAPPPPHEFTHHFPPRWIFYVRDLVLMIFVAGLGTAIRTSLRWREAEEKLLEAERQNTEVELKNLKNQLNPHFLLNTLNNIYALIALNSDKAQEAVQELSKLLRHVLYDNQQNFVSLEKELDFIRHYVALMRIRLPQQVKVSLNLDMSTGCDIEIAPLLFISLIENAFKHGISPTQSCFISIAITGEENGMVRCEILNSNYPKNDRDKSGSGIGLEQVNKRLELIYSGHYEWLKGISDNGQVYSSILTIQTQNV